MVELNRVYNCDCFDGIKELDNNSVSLVVTSPPYAMQRKFQYGGIAEKDYPQWTVDWMELLKQKLKDDASVMINIRPHIKNGEISDYVLRTRLALREAGWKECEELIWVKTTSPPMGSTERPRRAWESILWFSKTNKPKCYPKANGTESNRIGFAGSKFEEGGTSHIHAGQNLPTQKGVARCVDYIMVGTGNVEKGYNHPAMFPPELPEYLIKMLSDEGDLVLDPFIGSGTTGRVAERLNRKWIGFEINKEYCE
jgi:DNA modification methylase